MVESHAAFFDSLADLIDAKYYHGSDTATVSTKHMKHSQKAAAKALMKQQRKQHKRAKLDPDQAATTTELQKTGRAQQDDASDGDSEDEDGGAAPGPGSRALAEGALPPSGRFSISQGPAPSRDELMQRLHTKLEVARQQRHAEDGGKKGAGTKSPSDRAKEWRDKQLRKVPGGSGAAKDKAAGAKRRREDVQSAPQQRPAKQAHAEAGRAAKQPVAAAGGAEPSIDEGALLFGKLEVDSGRRGGGAGGSGAGHASRKKLSKADLLKAAEEKRRRLEEARATPDGKEAVQAEAWTAALQRARGEKVLDDPKLLRRSLKKDQKRKQKSAQTWAARNAATAETRDARQQRRKDNLQARVTAKVEKKKAKRDKKLLRAGFEGRKEGFITPKSKGTPGGGGK